MKRAGRRALERLGLYWAVTLARRGPLLADGWIRSVRAGEPVDAAGKPIPWIAYPAIEFLARRVRPDMRVFEYGCGNSTLWWAARVSEVVACEHDRAWYEHVRARAPSNVTLHHVALEYGGEYGRVAARFPGRFDIVVVDGRDRVHCARHAVLALKPDGVILFDDICRPQYGAAFEFLAAHGFRVIPFIGMAPVFAQKAETGVFYRSANCLGL